MQKRSEEKHPDDNVLNNISYVMRYTWRFDRIIILYVLLQAMVGVLAPLFGIYLPVVILKGVTKTISMETMLWTVGGLSLGMTVFNFTSTYMNSVIDTNLMNNRMRYLSDMLRKRMDADYQNIESSEGQNKFEKGMGVLFNDNSGAFGMLKMLGGLLAAILGFFLYSGIISKLSPIIILVLIFTSVIHFFVLKNISKYEYECMDKWAPYDRKINYILRKISDYTVGKDIRLYSMRTWLIDTLNSVLTTRIKWFSKVAKRKYLAVLSDAITLIIRDGVAYYYIFHAILNGKMQIAEFVLYFGAIAGFSTFITNIIEGMDTIVRTSHDMSAIRDFLEMPDQNVGEKVLNKDDIRYESFSVEFRNVSFRYTQDTPFIFENLSFFIKKGEKIALVGENGAGKTTLIKLLCGFYKPNAGEIYINGILISDLNREFVYSLYAAVFQEIFILPMTAAQNVALAQDSSIDMELVRRCMEWAGLGQRITDIDMPLTKMIDDKGIDLSGGETQKLMIARAIYKNAAALILDEPTAALDPISEAQLYERYNEMVKNKTSIFVSHRLASTRFCDRIFFLDKGRIVECGTHDELVCLNGLYGKLYSIQSQYYKDSVK